MGLINGEGLSSLSYMRHLKNMSNLIRLSAPQPLLSLVATFKQTSCWSARAESAP